MSNRFSKSNAQWLTRTEGHTCRLIGRCSSPQRWRPGPGSGSDRACWLCSGGCSSESRAGGGRHRPAGRGLHVRAGRGPVIGPGSGPGFCELGPTGRDMRENRTTERRNKVKYASRGQGVLACTEAPLLAGSRREDRAAGGAYDSDGLSAIGLLAAGHDDHLVRASRCARSLARHRAVSIISSPNRPLRSRRRPGWRS